MPRAFVEGPQAGLVPPMPAYHPSDRVIGNDPTKPIHYRVPGTIAEECDGGEFLVQFDDGLSWVLPADALQPIGSDLPEHTARRIPQVVIPGPPCDCGHPDEDHSPVPGIGCTHRPCLCLSPTGERVARVNWFAPALRPDPDLIVRGVR